jgi:hypothetical protein
MAFSGTAKVKQDGKELAEAPGTAKLEPGGIFGRTIMTGTKVLGTTDAQVKPGAVEGTFFAETSEDAVALVRLRNGVIQFVESNGTRWVIPGASQVGENPAIEEGDQGMQITGCRFEGQPAEPVN